MGQTKIYTRTADQYSPTGCNGRDLNDVCRHFFDFDGLEDQGEGDFQWTVHAQFAETQIQLGQGQLECSINQSGGVMGGSFEEDSNGGSLSMNGGTDTREDVGDERDEDTLGGMYMEESRHRPIPLESTSGCAQTQLSFSRPLSSSKGFLKEMTLFYLLLLLSLLESKKRINYMLKLGKKRVDQEAYSKNH
jgi:hypothetical protein